jgi:hypothetical protein
MLEVVPAGVNKWAGLQRLMARLGLPASALMAVGDGGNDLAMLQGAGLGVAVRGGRGGHPSGECVYRFSRQVAGTGLGTPWFSRTARGVLLYVRKCWRLLSGRTCHVLRCRWPTRCRSAGRSPR